MFAIELQMRPLLTYLLILLHSGLAATGPGLHWALGCHGPSHRAASHREPTCTSCACTGHGSRGFEPDRDNHGGVTVRHDHSDCAICKFFAQATHGAPTLNFALHRPSVFRAESPTLSPPPVSRYGIAQPRAPPPA